MKEDVAADGAPARTTIVGRRRMRPSTNPRRVYSLIKISSTSFAMPYAPWGVAIVSGVITGGYSVVSTLEPVTRTREDGAHEGSAIDSQRRGEDELDEGAGLRACMAGSVQHRADRVDVHLVR